MLSRRDAGILTTAMLDVVLIAVGVALLLSALFAVRSISRKRSKRRSRDRHEGGVDHSDYGDTSFDDTGAHWHTGGDGGGGEGD